MKLNARFGFWAVIVLVGIAAAGMLRVATLQGLGLGNDSVAYIGGAQSLLAGNGYSRIWLTDQAPITHFPPLMSLILAFGGWIGLEVEPSAYWMIIGLYGLNTILTGYLAWRFSGLRCVGVLAAVLLAASPNLLRVHSFVMSEPLFLFFSLVFFVLLERAVETYGLRWIFLIGVVTGLAFLTRYVGLALAVTFGIAVLLTKWGWRMVLKAVALFSAGALPLIFAWLVRNQLVAGSVTNRQFIWHPLTMEKIQFGLENLWLLFVPARMLELLEPYWRLGSLFWLVLGVIGLAWLVWAGYKFNHNTTRAQFEPGKWTGWLLGVYEVVYMLVMLISMSVYDAATIFEHRILAPLYVVILVGGAVLAGWLWQKRINWLRLAVAIMVGGLVLLGGVNQVRKVETMRHDAQGFASRVWKESAIISAIQELPEDKVIYTNKPTLVYILTKRVPNMLPTPYDTALALDRETYQEDLATLRLRADQERAAIVVLGWEWMDTPQGLDWHRQVIAGLTAVTNSSEGTMYLAHP
jgi:4-amino-4-deoxy-L-arabinose transferase-like glycosyltransferase